MARLNTFKGTEGSGKSDYQATFHHLPTVIDKQGVPIWLEMDKCDAHLHKYTVRMPPQPYIIGSTAASWNWVKQFPRVTQIWWQFSALRIAPCCGYTLAARGSVLVPGVTRLPFLRSCNQTKQACALEYAKVQSGQNFSAMLRTKFWKSPS